MVSDSVVRSQSGRIIQNTLSDSWVADPRTETSTYTFDAAGRLTQAVIPRHVLSYGFGDTTCGVGASDLAGRNGNRTSFSDVKDAGIPITTDYCYDGSDRLVSTAVAALPPRCPPTQSRRSSPFAPLRASSLCPTGTRPPIPAT